MAMNVIAASTPHGDTTALRRVAQLSLYNNMG
jgi:hypothetical protein